jgi:hypothetical protein
VTQNPTYSELLDSFEDQRLLIEIGRDLMPSAMLIACSAESLK